MFVTIISFFFGEKDLLSQRGASYREHHQQLYKHASKFCSGFCSADRYRIRDKSGSVSIFAHNYDCGIHYLFGNSYVDKCYDGVCQGPVKHSIDHCDGMAVFDSCHVWTGDGGGCIEDASLSMEDMEYQSYNTAD